MADNAKKNYYAESLRQCPKAKKIVGRTRSGRFGKSPPGRQIGKKPNFRKVKSPFGGTRRLLSRSRKRKRTKLKKKRRRENEKGGNLTQDGRVKLFFVEVTAQT